MLFALYNVDVANSAPLRAAHRPAHVAHVEAHAAHIKFAGPQLLDDGSAPIGGLVIFDAPDRAFVETYARQDPYTKAGVYAEVRITALRQFLPKT